jgi:hypothetical protein
MQRMVEALSPIWRTLVCREMERRSFEAKRFEQLKINSIISHQNFSICLMENRGQICNCCVVQQTLRNIAQFTTDKIS